MNVSEPHESRWHLSGVCAGDMMVTWNPPGTAPDGDVDNFDVMIGGVQHQVQLATDASTVHSTFPCAFGVADGAIVVRSDTGAFATCVQLVFSRA